MAAYADCSGDPAPASLSHHYVAYRAFVRVKIACLRVVQGDPAAGFEARQLAEVALRHLRAEAVTLVVVGGLPGTGKSALAGAVAGRLGFTVLNSDRIRKELAGLPAEASTRAPYGGGIYTGEWTERTYAELLHRAAVLLAHGESVIADASFASARQRAAAVAAAAGVSADLVQLRCTASRDLAARRMSARTGAVSDADPAIAAEMAAVMAPWLDATVIDTETGDTAGVPGESLEQALEAIRPRGPEHVCRPPGRTCSPGELRQTRRSGIWLRCQVAEFTWQVLRVPSPKFSCVLLPQTRAAPHGALGQGSGTVTVTVKGASSWQVSRQCRYRPRRADQCPKTQSASPCIGSVRCCTSLPSRCCSPRSS